MIDAILLNLLDSPRYFILSYAIAMSFFACIVLVERALSSKPQEGQ